MITPGKEITPGESISAYRLKDAIRRDRSRTLQPTRGMISKVDHLGSTTRPAFIPPQDTGSGVASVIVKITGNASGGGKYNGRILTGASTAGASGDEGQPEGMTVPGADNALVLNLEEDGLPTHWLLAGSFAVGNIVGMTTDSPPLSIVEITGGGAPRIASPQELASGTGDSAQADTWKRDRVTSSTDYGDVPVKIPVSVRPVYNYDGDKVIYKMVRYMIFATDGRLQEVTAETRVSVDAVESC